jgi:hypothetical protein
MEEAKQESESAMVEDIEPTPSSGLFVDPSPPDPLSDSSSSSDTADERGELKEYDPDDFLADLHAEREMKLFDVAGDLLYPNARITTHHARSTLFRIQSHHNWTDGSLKDLFDYLNHILPPENNLGTHREATEAITAEEEDGAEWVDCCVNDCCLFENAPLEFDPHRERQLADEDYCRTCGLARYGDKGKPHKVFRRFSLPVHLRRLFLNPSFAAKVRLRRPRRGAWASDLHNSVAWKEKVWDDPEFSAELRNLMLTLCSDGFVPFRGSQHSIWSDLCVK